MEIYLIRHTRVAVPKSVCYGQSDVPVADTFDSDKESVLSKLSRLKNPLVYSSPASRCRVLADCLGDTVQTDERLQELHFGRWEMQPWEAISPAELNPWMDDFVHVSPPDGESFAQLHHRCLDFWAELIQANSQDAVVLVTHAGVIRSLLCHCLGVPLANAFRLAVDYGFVCRIRCLDGVPVIQF
ncbi:MAG: alpha-ribazole phosphatase [Cytophagales bacterium]|nr:alpha-ribazole phosphatase [Cytophagales bacterium]